MKNLSFRPPVHYPNLLNELEGLARSFNPPISSNRLMANALHELTSGQRDACYMAIKKAITELSEMYTINASDALQELTKVMENKKF